MSYFRFILVHGRGALHKCRHITIRIHQHDKTEWTKRWREKKNNTTTLMIIGIALTNMMSWNKWNAYDERRGWNFASCYPTFGISRLYSNFLLVFWSIFIYNDENGDFSFSNESSEKDENTQKNIPFYYSEAKKKENHRKCKAEKLPRYYFSLLNVVHVVLIVALIYSLFHAQCECLFCIA